MEKSEQNFPYATAVHGKERDPNRKWPI